MRIIRAVLVENLERPHRIYRRLLEKVDGVELVGAFYDAETLLEQLDRGLRPDVILMDVRMDDRLDGLPSAQIDGIEAARRIRQQFPRMAIILYSMWENPEYYRRIDEARFVTRYAFVKRYSLDDWDRLGEIIRLVMNGQTYIDLEVRVEMDLLKQSVTNSPLQLLDNDDQRKILALMAIGLSNEEIAQAMARKSRWVEEEVKKIYTALKLTGESSGDSRRIRAARMFDEGRVLIWESQPDGSIEVLAEDSHGSWRPLREVKHSEQQAREDAKILNNAVT